MTAKHLREGDVEIVTKWLREYHERGYTDTRHFYARRGAEDLSLTPMLVGEALAVIEDDGMEGFNIERDDYRNSSPIRWVLEETNE